ncbi:unnamed protein product [Cuscuta campestris]|uniref:Integrase catalytic domain-containing protein n=1 Tax=Cuscuta campestris TaxID=132261 RepID=A0A484LAU8_9ASTE|nr:unnamed protein product [Cuscuta campestris]
MDMGGVDVSRVLVDTGSSVNVLYLDAFEKLKLCRTRLEPLKTPLSGFTGDSVEAEGSILLTCELGTGDQVVQKQMRFVVVNIKCVHNAILGRSGINKVRGVISMAHLCMKFYTPGGIGQVRGDQKKARHCYLEAIKKMTKAFERVTLVSQEEDRSKLEPGDETEQIVLREAFPERMVAGVQQSQGSTTGVIEADDDWRYDLMEYLMTGQKPNDEERARKVVLRSPRFQVLDGHLYKRAIGGPLLRCLTNPEAERVIAKRCRTCQVFYKHPGRPATYYQPTSNVIPFARFGIDIIGAFSVAQGGKKFVMVAIDYFTKWIEAEAMATITVWQCEKFVWKNIITRFGALKMIVTDNGPQFRNPRFTEFLASFGIKHSKASVAYPQGNGQVENANRTIVDGLKKRLGEEGHKWLEALPHTVWAHRVTSSRATGETPFVLTYGCEARLPVEAEIPTFREAVYQPGQNEVDHLAELNLVEERRTLAAVKMAGNQRSVKRYHDNRVGPRYFQVHDEVLRRRVLVNQMREASWCETGKDPIA